MSVHTTSAIAELPNQVNQQESTSNRDRYRLEYHFSQYWHTLLSAGPLHPLAPTHFTPNGISESWTRIRVMDSYPSHGLVSEYGLDVVYVFRAFLIASNLSTIFLQVFVDRFALIRFAFLIRRLTSNSVLSVVVLSSLTRWWKES